MKMNKFERNLTSTNKEIKGKRATMIVEDTKSAFIEKEQNLSARKRDIERAIMQLEDINVDSKMSLSVVGPEFNAKKWIEDMTALKIQLVNIELEEEILSSIKTEWLTDEK